MKPYINDQRLLISNITIFFQKKVQKRYTVEPLYSGHHRENVSTIRCPPRRGFLRGFFINPLPEQSVRYKVFAIEDIRYREVLLYIYNFFCTNIYFYVREIGVLKKRMREEGEILETCVTFPIKTNDKWFQSSNHLQ